MENAIYEESINSFFTALDNKDSGAIKSLFSKAVIESDPDLDEQIEKLISIYPNSKTEIIFDGLLAGEYEKHYGKLKSAANKTFPIVCDSKYYWVYYELIYEDDFSEENIGVNSVFFYTADEYCAFFHDDNSKYSDDIGLCVFSDLELEKEVRPINGYPHEFTPIDRTINISDVEIFLDSNKSWTEFTQTFGEPNATGILWTYYYEIIETDGSVKYLEIGVPDVEIEYVNIVSDFEYIRCILEEVSE